MKLMKKRYIAMAICSVLGTSAYAEEGSFRHALQNGKFSADINNVLAVGSETDAGSGRWPNEQFKSW